MRAIKYIQQFVLAVVVVSAALLSSCAVHEWPKGPKPTYPFVINLEYDSDMELYRIVDDYYKDQKPENLPTDGYDVDYVIPEGYDVRYVIEVYTKSDIPNRSGELVTRKVENKGDVTDLDNSIEMSLPAGSYTFKVWTDYSDAESQTDKFYNTRDFNAIVFNGDYTANTDARDAFVGSLDVDIDKTTTEINITNSRPLGKFVFISTDLNVFIDNVLEQKAKEASEKAAKSQRRNGVVNDDLAKVSRSDSKISVRGSGAGSAEIIESSSTVDINDYKVVFSYVSYLPSEFNIFEDDAVDAVQSKTFESSIKALNETDAIMGFDYVFVKEEGTTVQIVVEVFDGDGNSVSRTNPISVPLMRSEYTIVRSNYLTSKATGGVGVDPGFEGDYIYIVP